jgi:hypothetical protein
VLGVDMGKGGILCISRARTHRSSHRGRGSDYQLYVTAEADVLTTTARPLV